MKSPEIVFPARLGQPPSRVYAGNGEFRENRSEWLQPLDLWTVIFYQHSNSATVNARTFAVKPHSIMIFAPGVRASHAWVGDGSEYAYLSFNLPATEGRRYAIPTIITDGKLHWDSMQSAVAKVSSDLLPAFAFAWQFMHHVSLDPVHLRLHEALYSAEEYITKNLHDELRVPAIADHANVSARQLLRMFRDEHRLTIKEFIRARRTQEACRLLMTSTRPIKVVADKVGYSDLAQFNKLIRKETGLSPRAFRVMSNQKS